MSEAQASKDSNGGRTLYSVQPMMPSAARWMAAIKPSATLREPARRPIVAIGLEIGERHGQSRLIMPASISSRLNRRASAPSAQR